jgi:hypothetical protein
MKCFRRKDSGGEPPGLGRNGTRDFHDGKRSNETHASTSNPDARLAWKCAGQEAKLAFMEHLLMENKAGLIVNTRLTAATGSCEQEAAIAKLNDVETGHRISMGADKVCDTADFVAELPTMKMTPYVARNITAYRGSNIAGGPRGTPVTKSADDPETDRGSQWLDQDRGGMRGSRSAA